MDQISGSVTFGVNQMSALSGYFPYVSEYVKMIILLILKSFKELVHTKLVVCSLTSKLMLQLEFECKLKISIKAAFIDQ